MGTKKPKKRARCRAHSRERCRCPRPLRVRCPVCRRCYLLAQPLLPYRQHVRRRLDYPEVTCQACELVERMRRKHGGTREDWINPERAAD